MVPAPEAVMLLMQRYPTAPIWACFSNWSLATGLQHSPCDVCRQMGSESSLTSCQRTELSELRPATPPGIRGCSPSQAHQTVAASATLIFASNSCTDPGLLHP